MQRGRSLYPIQTHSVLSPKVWDRSMLLARKLCLAASLFQPSSSQQKGQNKFVIFTCQLLPSNFPRLFISRLKIHYCRQHNGKSEHRFFTQKCLVSMCTSRKQRSLPFCTATIPWCLIFNVSISKVTLPIKNYRKYKCIKCTFFFFS